MLAAVLLGSVVALHTQRPAPVVVDSTDPDVAYAVGANWKASFDLGGTEFVPFLGVNAPRSEHVRFALSRATVDGRVLSSRNPAAFACTDGVVWYAHDGFEEVFETRREGVEHSLVFRELPRRGEIVVTTALDSSLPARQVGDTIEFGSEAAGVRYPAATAYDATGRSLSIPARLQDGALVLTVPAEFAASAQLPLSIDPLIHVFGIATTTPFDIAPDASYVNFSGGARRCEVFERAWSLTDHDVTARVTNMTTGSTTDFLIDATTEYWSEPKVASIVESKVTASFLVVAAAGHPTSGARTIRARKISIQFSGPSLGAVQNVGTSVTGDKHHPDVGGDPYAAGGGTGSYYMVVFQADQVGGDTDVWGGPFGFSTSPIAVSSLTDDENPRISKGNGTFAWGVAWQRSVAPGNSDVIACKIDQAGPVVGPLLTIASTGADEVNPSVSSPGQGGFLVAFQRDMGGQHDVFLRRFYTAVDAEIAFTQLEGGAHGPLDQKWPVVDGSFNGHLLTYREDDPVSPGSKRTRFTSFAISAANLVALHEVHQSVGNPGLPRTAANVASYEASILVSAPFPQYDVVWDESVSPTDSDVYGALFFDGAGQGGVVATCFGDGSITACPCTQNGGTPAGCPNSAAATGGEMEWTGVADVSNDTFVVRGLRLTPSSPILLVGGSSLVLSGVVFGDGLRCVAGTLSRLVVRTTSATGTFTYPDLVTDPRISVADSLTPAGGTRIYQLVFRDAAPFCTAGTYNTTNALAVTWVP